MRLRDQVRDVNRKTLKGNRKVQIFLKLTLWALFFYLIYCCFLFLVQRQMIFPRYLIVTPLGTENQISGIEKIWIDTRHGKVEAWFLPPSSGQNSDPAPAVIFAHGNAELIDFWPQELKKLTNLGIGVLLVEYPGYGRSKGAPSQKSITETFITAYDILVKRKEVDPSRIILFGRSIGGGAVCRLAAERPSAALILMSTFTSVQSYASKYLVPKFLIRDPFDNLSVVGAYSGPVLIIHGKYDNIIPYKHGVTLCGAAKHCKMISYDCAHNDCPPNWDTFWQFVESFLHEIKIIK